MTKPIQVSQGFIEGSKLVSFRQEYKIWNMLEENIIKNFDIRDPKVLSYCVTCQKWRIMKQK